jgi:hypothetical protein
MKFIAYFGFALTASLLTGCGGGGGTPAATGPVVSTLTFPLRAASNAITANGESVTLTAIGTSATQITDGLCSGTLTGTSGPANSATTFEGLPALSSVVVSTLSFSNCTPASTSTTYTDYYDSNYLPLGTNVSGGSYTVWLTPPTIPASATVGATAIIGTETYYTNSTKSILDGRRDVSMVVEADTANTAVVNAISKRYNQSNQLLYTSQTRRRIDTLGATTYVSSDIQYATTSTLHLVFRR